MRLQSLVLPWLGFNWEARVKTWRWEGRLWLASIAVDPTGASSARFCMAMGRITLVSDCCPRFPKLWGLVVGAPQLPCGLLMGRILRIKRSAAATISFLEKIYDLPTMS